MPRDVHVHMLPALADATALAGGVAVMIDVLRASTTIVHALAAGATTIVPCETVEEARRAAGRYPPGDVLLGGERRGRRIDGFDLGNSPLEYTSERVAGKTIVFTTTNGTRALRTCAAAERVLIGAFVNRAALVRALLEERGAIHLVCAGTEGKLTAEDILCAGALATDLRRDERPGGGPRPGCASEVDVQTQTAIDYYLARSRSRQTLLETIRDSRGGRNLIKLGITADIDRAAEENRLDVVPAFTADPPRITRTACCGVNPLRRNPRRAGDR